MRGTILHTRLTGNRLHSRRKAPRSLRIAQYTLALVIVLSLSVLSHAVTAFASDGSVTIMRQDGSEMSYRAYPLFFADISENDQAINVAWSNEATRDIVLPYLDQNGYAEWLDEHHPSEGQHDVAQNAAEYCSDMIAGSDYATGFSNGLARCLANHSELKPALAYAGTPFVCEEGYWLFVSDAATERFDDAGTAPLWIAIGGSTTTIIEKSAVPSVHLEIKEDSTDLWDVVADAHAHQSLSYRLTGTLPSNLHQFDTYRYRLIASFDTGLGLTVPQGKGLEDALAVSIDGQRVSFDSDELTASFDQGELVVDFTDILSSHWDSYGISPSSVVTVDFLAQTLPDAKTENMDKACRARLEYTADPVSQQLSQTHEVSVKEFSYTIRLHKTDQADKSLKGATFTIQVSPDNSDMPSRDSYVQSDGSLSPNPFAFVSDEQGIVSVHGLDEGTFTIVETAPPEGFKQLSEPISLTLTSTFDTERQLLEELQASVTSSAARLEGIDTTAGVITVRITNEPVPPPNTPTKQEGTPSSRERLPQTGVGPLAEALVGAGFILLLTTLVHWRHHAR